MLGGLVLLQYHKQRRGFISIEGMFLRRISHNEGCASKPEK